jgi:hypothetical protein
MTAMKDMSIVEGKLEMDYPLIARKIRESDKYDYSTVEHTNEKCAIKFVELDEDSEVVKEQVIEYTIQDGLKADLIDNIRDDGSVKARSKRGSKMPWEKHTKNMLFARVMSNAVKWFCPDVTGGSVYHKGEISNAPDIGTRDDTEPSEGVGAKVVDGDFEAEQSAKETKPCPEHEGATLTKKSNEKGEWWSHKLGDEHEDDWCNAKPESEKEDESGSGDNGEERPEWADEWLDRSISQIKDAYAQDKVTLDGIIDRERQLPEDEQRKTLLDWANAQLDKQEADTEAHDPEEAESLA